MRFLETTPLGWVRQARLTHARRALLASELRLERQGEAQAFHLEPASDAFGSGAVLYFHADTEAASSDFPL